MNMNSILMKMQQDGVPFTLYPAFRALTGSSSGTIFLSYLASMDVLHNGRPFTLTDEQVRNDTGLTRNELTALKKRLKQTSFLKIERKGMPVKTHYEFDHQELEKALSAVTSDETIKKGA